MSLVRLPVELRRRAIQSCAAITIPQRRRGSSSPLFALHALSNARETQHLNKLSGLSRVEHSPALESIKRSEVDPFVSNKAVKKLVSTSPPEEEEKAGIDHAALVTLPVAARRAIWLAWYESDRSTSLSDLAQRWKEGQAMKGLSPGAETVATPLDSNASIDIRSPNTPLAVTEPLVKNIGEPSKDQEALMIGRAVLNGQTEQQHQRLQRELEIARSETEKLKDDLKKKNDGSGGLIFLGIFLGVFVGVAYGVYPSVMDLNPSAPRETVASLEEQLHGAKNKQAMTEHGLISDKTRLEAQVRGLETKIEQEISASNAPAEVEGAKNTAYAAIMADWSRTAGNVKQAIEKRDAKQLSEVELQAYVDALSFLGVVKDRLQPPQPSPPPSSQRGWWEGLFWK